MIFSGNRFSRQLHLGAALLLAMIFFVLQASYVAEADHTTTLLNIEIKIKSINAIGCPDRTLIWCNDADYRMYIDLDNVRYTYPQNEHWDTDNYWSDDNSIEPDWLAPDAFGKTGPRFGDNKMTFKIDLWDVDGGLRGDNDHMDISPQDTKYIKGEILWDYEDFTWARVVLPGGDGNNDLEIELDPIQGCDCFGVFGYALQGTSGDSDWRAKVKLDINIKETAGIGVEEEGDKVRPIGIHSPLHPEPDDALTITGAIVNEWGKPVEYDTLQIWIDPDGKNPHDDAYILIGNGTCWQDGTSTGSTCKETIDLSTIPEPGNLADDEQRTIGYSIRAEDIGDHIPGKSSEWRLTTVGNRTNSKFIGFSLGTGRPRNAVDFLYTAHATDYGATGCSNQAIPVHLSGTEIPTWFTSTPKCTTPIDQKVFTTMVRDNWMNTFMSAEQWAHKNDYKAVTRDSQNNDSQRWILTDLGSGTFNIQQKINGRYLDAYESGGSHPGPDYSVVTRPTQNNDSQRWILTDLGSKTFTIQQKSTGRYLDAYEEDLTVNNDRIQKDEYRLVTRPTQNNDSQRWILTDLGSGTFNIQQKINGRYVDAHEDDKVTKSGISGTSYGFTHLDVITQNLDKMNFWYSIEPAIGEGSDAGCDLSTPKILTTDPDTGLVISASTYGWFEVAFVLHETPWRDCAPGGGKKVTIERREYPTTLHEMGHRPFGLSDQYCCDGGYAQRMHFPNVYAEMTDVDIYVPWDDLLEDATDYGTGDNVPGCEDDAYFGNKGVPYPPALNLCEEIVDNHGGSRDWYSPQSTSQWLPGKLLKYPGNYSGGMPNGELMSDHRVLGVPVDADSISVVPPGLGKVRVQAGPQTTKRILWFLQRCDSGIC